VFFNILFTVELYLIVLVKESTFFSVLINNVTCSSMVVLGLSKLVMMKSFCGHS